MMASTFDIIMSIGTQNIQDIFDLFKVNKPSKKWTSEIPNIGTASHLATVKNPGMTGEDIIVSIVITVAAGIPVNLVSNWIYDNICRKNQHKVTFGDNPNIVTKKVEIERVIEKISTTYYGREK